MQITATVKKGDVVASRRLAYAQRRERELLLSGRTIKQAWAEIESEFRNGTADKALKLIRSEKKLRKQARKG